MERRTFPLKYKCIFLLFICFPLKPGVIKPSSLGARYVNSYHFPDLYILFFPPLELFLVPVGTDSKSVTEKILKNQILLIVLREVAHES